MSSRRVFSNSSGYPCPRLCRRSSQIEYFSFAAKMPESRRSGRFNFVASSLPAVKWNTSYTTASGSPCAAVCSAARSIASLSAM